MFVRSRVEKYFADVKARSVELFARSLVLSSSKSITVLVGARRSGKTHILFSRMNELVSKNVVFLNFEAPVLSKVTSEEFVDLLELYLSLYSPQGLLHIFIDEPQTVLGWEQGVRYLQETFDCQLYVTGSSSKLLSKDIATSLRGRTITYTVYPLSFQEFLSFKEYGYSVPFSTKVSSDLKMLFEEFLEFGGFPEVVLASSSDEKKRILKDYYDLVVYKDIVDRFNIKNTRLIKYLIDYVVSTNTKPIGIHKLFKTLQSQGLSLSKNTLYEYFSILQDVFFVHSLKKYSSSLRKQELSYEKPYLLDVGYMNLFSLDDYGKRLENVVFLELLRVYETIFFEKDQRYECDFILVRGKKVTQAIQVCYELSAENESREIKGLLVACDKHKLKKGLLLTYDEERTIVEKGVRIDVLPVWKWLLQEKK